MLVAALLAATATPSQVFAADTVFVIRHLQKAQGSDPPLSAEGAANAQALAGMLARSGIRAIFATPTRRAMQTAEPLATKLAIKVTSYDPARPEALAAAVGAIPGAVLIVGHSNTVPDLVARLGGKGPVSVGEQDYGTVFVVTSDGTVSQVKVQRVPSVAGPGGAG
jgi:broad specificity phosphatase PhoE